MGYDEDLIAAARDGGHYNLVLELIRQGANVNVTDSNDHSPLHYAAWEGHYDICRILLDNGAETNTLTNDDYYPLTLAIHFQHENIFRLLLEKEVDPNLKTRNNGTAMDYALKGNTNYDIVSLLIQHGADVNNVKGKRTPLHWACENGHKELVELLLHKGANVEAMDDNNMKPLDIARNKDYKEIVHMFENDYLLWLRLYHASLQGNYDECKALLEQKALADSSQRGLYCPMAVALEKGHLKIVQLLLEKGMDINYKDIIERNPLFLATKYGHKDVTSMLLDKGANRNIKVEGDNLLHVTTRNNDEELTRLLLQEEMNPNIKNNDGYTPLHYAVVNGNENLVNCLLEHSANCKIASKKMETPLHLACETVHRQIVDYLLKNGANVEVLNEQNENMIDIVRRKRVEIELEIQNKLQVIDEIKKLLMSPKEKYPTATTIPDNFSNSDLENRNGSTADNQNSSGEDYDSDATVDYTCSLTRSYINKLNSRTMKYYDIEKLNTKISQLSNLVSELNVKPLSLALIQSDLALETFTLVNLERKMEYTRVLKELKSEDKNAQVTYEDAMQQLKKKINETKQKETQLTAHSQELHTEFTMMKTQVQHLHREISQFIKKIDLI